MADIMCPMCKKTLCIKELEGQENVRAWSCGHCLHAWRTEPWNTSGAIEFFKDAQYTQVENVERITAAKIKLFKKFLQWANEAKPQPPRLMVDFGCSYGTVMQMFKENDWEVMGIEISPTAQKILKEKMLPFASSLEQSELAFESVDVIVMADCIYYLPEPVKILREIRTYLKPSGLLFLRQPTRGGLIHLLSIINKEKALIDALWLDHVHLFSRRSTALLLEKSGFGSIQFLKERGYRRHLNGEVIHRLLRAIDCFTFGFCDLTLSWTVIAKAR